MKVGRYRGRGGDAGGGYDQSILCNPAWGGAILCASFRPSRAIL